MIRLFAFLFLISQNVVAQDKSDYTWVFGGDITDSLDNYEGSIIDFTNNTRTTHYQEILIPMGVTNSSIADRETGRLLFYTNGCSIMDSIHNIMLNGNNINPGEIHNDFCNEGLNFPQFNTTIILDDPVNSSTYHVFHQNRVPKTAPSFGLLYSQVKTDLNNGLGEVTQKNEILIDYLTLQGSYVSACRKPNNEGWWLMVMEHLNNDLFLFSVDTNGINLKDTLKQNIPFSQTISSSGHSCFSPDGSTYAWYNPYDEFHVYDFDRINGTISNYRHVDVPEYNNGNEFTGAVSISPSSQFAYLSSDGQMYQVDLWSDNLQQSLTFIAEWDGFGDPFPNTFSSIMHGPDCKMYVASGAGVKHLGIIHYPDNKGIDCEFRQHDLELPWHKSSGNVPNFPHFRTDEEEPCDDQISNTSFIAHYPSFKITATPNPTSDQIYFSFPEVILGKSTIQIYDSMGKLIKQIAVRKYLLSKNANVSDIPSGIYYFKLVSNSKTKGSGSFVKL